jgi:hypothetical protein
MISGVHLCARRLELSITLAAALLAGACGRLRFENVGSSDRDSATIPPVLDAEPAQPDPDELDADVLDADDAESTPEDAGEPDAELPDAELPDAELPDAELSDACPPAACVARRPILYWKLDESTESMAHDESTSMLNGSYVGDTGLPSPSPLVPSVQFADSSSRAFLAGSRHAVRLANMPAVLRPALEFTLSIWYRASTTDSSGGELISAGNDYLLRVKPGLIEFAKRINATDFGACNGFTNVVLNGVWHHVAGVNSGSGMISYLDGTQICTNTDARAPHFGMGGPDLWLGRHGNLDTRFDFEGNLDDARIYDRALSADEVARLAAGFEY